MSKTGWTIKMRSATSCSVDTMLLATFMQRVKHIILSRLYQLRWTSCEFVIGVGFMGSVVSIGEPRSEVTKTSSCIHRLTNIPMV